MKYRTPDWTEEDWQKSYEEAITWAQELVDQVGAHPILITNRSKQCLSLQDYKDLDILALQERDHIKQCLFCTNLWAYRIFIDNPPA